LVFTQGQCKAVVAGEEKTVNAGDLVIVPQGTKHNFINTGKEPLICFTIYAPGKSVLVGYFPCSEPEADASDFSFPAEHDPKSVHKSEYFSSSLLV
jgi:uncharacterized protein YjlB